MESSIKFNPDLESEGGKLYRQYCEEKGIDYSITAGANFCLGYMAVKPNQGAVWVKASERLPGWKKRVKWRDGNNHSYATDGEISLFEMEKPNLEGWEWYDESAATLNPELLQVIRDAEKSKEEDLKAVKEVIGGAAARREEAVEFAEWALREGWATSHDRKGWMKHSDDTPYVLTTTELNELFKQQKEK